MKVYSIRLNSKECGPSVEKFNDERTEIFLAGCKKAIDGNPCKGCFNQGLWNPESGKDVSLQEIVEYITKNTLNPYVSIVGGEPLDQKEELMELCKLLKKEEFHIVLFSHYTQLEILMNASRLFDYIDILIDGTYEEDKRIFDTDTRTGVYHVIGSSNQDIYYIKHDKDPELDVQINLFENITKEPEEVLRQRYSTCA